MADESDLDGFVERMFPAPVDHGIAEDDRAVANVQSGTDTPPERTGARALVRGRRTHWRESPRATSSSTRPPAALATQGDPFEPVKIGILVDMDLGQLLADWLDPTILAIEDALNEGVYDRPVRLVVGRRPGPAARELPEVPQGLRVARRPGLRRSSSVR